MWFDCDMMYNIYHNIKDVLMDSILKFTQNRMENTTENNPVLLKKKYYIFLPLFKKISFQATGDGLS